MPVLAWCIATTTLNSGGLAIEHFLEGEATSNGINQSRLKTQFIQIWRCLFFVHPWIAANQKVGDAQLYEPSGAIQTRVMSSRAATAAGPRVDNLIAFHPSQANGRLDNQSNIIYILKPVVFLKSRAWTPRNIYIYTFPRPISSKVEGCRADWSRVNRRITPEGIIDRVEPIFKMSANISFRQAFNVAA